MIGNDIVDLAQARQESNWRRTGFLDKAFTDYEQQLIQSASDPDRMVWTLWSMKESVYKLIVRETGQRCFALQKLVCQLNNSGAALIEGSVFCQRAYQTTSILTNHYVATVAFLPDTIPLFSQVIIPFDYADYQHQHRVIRERIKQRCAARFSIPEGWIQIQKNEAGVPELAITEPYGKTISRPISLSHHGHYGAFVIP